MTTRRLELTMESDVGAWSSRILVALAALGTLPVVSAYGGGHAPPYPQWLALVVLFAGVAVVGEASTSDAPRENGDERSRSGASSQGCSSPPRERSDWCSCHRSKRFGRRRHPSAGSSISR
jgi:hypothetical protein